VEGRLLSELESHLNSLDHLSVGPQWFRGAEMTIIEDIKNAIPNKELSAPTLPVDVFR